ncbi:metallophosphoesterase family protein [Roseococcus sp.]|uniref:metallophosphoesterase family protein n=1 Tax=Roseococcus sp. TaxID=2109646 RepID=UPI003BACA10E
MGEVVFIGDIHRQWHHVVRGLAGLEQKPAVAVLLGDMECDRPLDEVAAPLLDAGIDVRWIWGNHDYDGGPQMWANLTDPALNPRTCGGALNARVVEIGGLRIAGLGGTFRRRVWEPPHPRRLHGRAELAADVATLGADWTEAQRAAMADALGAMAIWPEDYDTLVGLRADVLVTHEAPSSHPQGFAMIDGLARAMGARLLVHGHHHVGYRARAEDGLEVQGVGAGWAMGLDGRTWWPGEADRWLGAFPKPWRST